MNRQEIVETIQEITGMAMMLGLSTPEQIRHCDPAFSNHFGADTMTAFYLTIDRNPVIRNKIAQGLIRHKEAVA
jgi:hypothetical protein